MTAEIVSPAKKSADRGRELSPEQAAAAAMVAEARRRGLELTGPGGLLKLFTKNVLETAWIAYRELAVSNLHPGRHDSCSVGPALLVPAAERRLCTRPPPDPCARPPMLRRLRLRGPSTLPRLITRLHDRRSHQRTRAWVSR
jgi:hypothetical protein